MHGDYCNEFLARLTGMWGEEQIAKGQCSIILALGTNFFCLGGGRREKWGEDSLYQKELPSTSTIWKVRKYWVKSCPNEVNSFATDFSGDRISLTAVIQKHYIKGERK